MVVHPLHEGFFDIDAEHNLRPIPNNSTQKYSFPIGITPFLIITSKDIIMLDTGIGQNNENKILKIYQNLYNVNISMYDITKVILSHLHHDHVKGIASIGTDNNLKLNFPNAQYYINQDDFNLTIQNTPDKEIRERLQFIANETNALHFYSGKQGQISEQIIFNETNAHCPHHNVFWIKEDNENIFFGADDAPQLHQMQMKIVAKYDFNPPLAAELRQQWWKQGNNEKWTFLFYHDLKNFTYKK